MSLPARIRPMRVHLLVSLLTALLCLIVTLGCSRSSDYYLERGKKLFAAGKYDDAAIQYRKALQKDPNSGRALYQLGLVQLQTNRLAEARQSLTRAVSALPEDDEAKIKLANASLAIYLVEPSRPRVLYDEIAKVSDQLLKKNPSSFDGLWLRGSLRLLDRRPKEAIDDFQKANQIKPLQHDLIMAYVPALFLDNQEAAGVLLAQELIQKEPAFGPVYDVLYRHYRSANQLHEAENILNLKVRNNPSQADFRVQLAEYYARQQNQTATTAALQPLLSDSQRFPQGLLKAGDFYANMGNWPEAQRRFEEGARNNPKDSLVYEKRIADALLMQGKRGDAAGIVDSILKDHPDDVDATRVRAVLRMETGKPEDVDAAIADFATLMKAAPDDAALHFNYGRAWLYKRDPSRAQTEFRQVVRAQPGHVPALTALAEIALAEHKPSDSLRYVQQILAYQPNNLNAKQLGVDSLMELGKLGEAQTEVALLQKEYPNNRDLQLRAGVLDLAQRKYKEAEAIFQSLNQSGQTDSRPVAALAKTYADQQQFDTAIQFLNAELKKTPNSIAIEKLLASTALQAGKYEVAIATYRDLVTKQPKSAELYTQLGRAYQTKGEFDAAIAAFQQAQQLAPNEALPVTLLALSLDKVHRKEEAKTNYQRALQLQPENLAVMNNLAYLLAESGGNLDDALLMAQRALRKEPGNPNYSDTLGYVYLKKKMTGSAIQTYNSLVNRYPNSPVYHYHLGMALMDAGDKVKAKVEFQDALANQPSQEDTVRLKELLSQLGA